MSIKTKGANTVDVVITYQRSELANIQGVLVHAWKSGWISKKEFFVDKGKLKTYGEYNI